MADRSPLHDLRPPAFAAARGPTSVSHPGRGAQVAAMSGPDPARAPGSWNPRGRPRSSAAGERASRGVPGR